jgi:hypothetical protein
MVTGALILSLHFGPGLQLQSTRLEYCQYVRIVWFPEIL